MKYNLFNLIFRIYFSSQKTFIINFIIFCLLIAIFSIFQINQVKDKNQKYKHTVKFYNVPYTRDGSQDWYFDNLDIEIKLTLKEYKIDQMNVYDITARNFSNNKDKSEELRGHVEEFINLNIGKNVQAIQEKINNMKKFHYTDYFDPMLIHTLGKKIETLSKEWRHSYFVNDNLKLNQVLGNSLILSFVLISVVRTLMIELNTKKKRKRN